MDPERLARLELLWRDMRARGSSWSPTCRPFIPSRGTTSTATRTSGPHCKSRPRSSRHSRASWGSASEPDPASVPCTEEEFLDGTHARDSCLTRIVQRMLR